MSLCSGLDKHGPIQDCKTMSLLTNQHEMEALGPEYPDATQIFKGGMFLTRTGIRVFVSFEGETDSFLLGCIAKALENGGTRSRVLFWTLDRDACADSVMFKSLDNEKLDVVDAVEYLTFSNTWMKAVTDGAADDDWNYTWR